MTSAAIVLWIVLGTFEMRRVLRACLADERELAAAPTASAVRQSFDTPTVWGES